MLGGGCRAAAAPLSVVHRPPVLGHAHLDERRRVVRVGVALEQPELAAQICQTVALKPTPPSNTVPSPGRCFEPQSHSGGPPEPVSQLATAVQYRMVCALNGWDALACAVPAAQAEIISTRRMHPDAPAGSYRCLAAPTC